MNKLAHHSIAACVFTVSCLCGTVPAMAQPDDNGLSMLSYCREFSAQSHPVQVNPVTPVMPVQRLSTHPDRAEKQRLQEVHDELAMAEVLADMDRSSIADGRTAANSRTAPTVYRSPEQMAVMNGSENGPDPAVMNAACRMAEHLKADNTSRMRILGRRLGH